MSNTAKYSIIRTSEGWTIDHDGSCEGDYDTKESAFEAIVLAASNTIKLGIGVSITVPPREIGESSLGGKPA